MPIEPRVRAAWVDSAANSTADGLTVESLEWLASSGRGRAVDAAGCLGAAAVGAFLLGSTLTGFGLPPARVAVDAACGGLACASLWWRRRSPYQVAAVCLVVGIFSVSATPAGLIGMLSLAVRRRGWPVLLVAASWVPAALLFGVYSPTTSPLPVVGRVVPLVLAVTAWGMLVRARRQGLRERAQRAEVDRYEHEERIRTAERIRVAREMHDVLGHRISLLALQAGALEVQPDLTPSEVRDTAGMLRTTARQALEELRAVIGVLRTEPGGGETVPVLRQPTLTDISELVAQTRGAGVAIDFEMQVEQPASAAETVGRDAYRVVQEALTNVARHAGGTVAQVRVTGGPERGLIVSIRNGRPTVERAWPRPPTSGNGLLGLRERVELAGGTLVHGRQSSGDFLVEAVLPWHR